MREIELEMGPCYLGDPLYFLPQGEYSGDIWDEPDDPWLEFCSEVVRYGIDNPFPCTVRGVDMVVLPCDCRNPTNKESLYDGTGFVCITTSKPLTDKGRVLKLKPGKIVIGSFELGDLPEGLLAQITIMLYSSDVALNIDTPRGAIWHNNILVFVA